MLTRRLRIKRAKTCLHLLCSWYNPSIEAIGLFLQKGASPSDLRQYSEKLFKLNDTALSLILLHQGLHPKNPFQMQTVLSHFSDCLTKADSPEEVWNCFETMLFKKIAHNVPEMYQYLSPDSQKQIKTMLLVRKAWQTNRASEHFFNQAKTPKPVWLNIALQSLGVKQWLLLMPEEMINEALEQTSCLIFTSVSQHNLGN